MPRQRPVCFEGIAAEETSKLSKETGIERRKTFSESDQMEGNATGNESTDHEREVERLAD